MATAPPHPDTEKPAAPSSPAGRWITSLSVSWLTSLCLHFVIVIVLALWSLPSLPSLELPLLTANSSEEEEQLEDVPLIEFDQAELETEITELAIDPVDEIVNEVAEVASFEAAAPAFVDVSPIGLTSPIASVLANGTGATEGFGRGERARAASVRSNGGSQGSELAVTRALDWIARHQNPNGTWSLRHDLGACNGRCPNPGVLRTGGDLVPTPPADSVRAATGLALLPFLGAGQTPTTGKHRQTIARGLAALIALGQPNQKGPGVSWIDPLGQMYSHGIAAIVLNEAYGLTGDRSIAPAAQSALDFIAYAQGPRGGWRYRPQQPGDVSVVGWQVAALKSGFLANLNVPPQVARGAYAYLNTAQHAGGSAYSYVSPQINSGPQGLPRPAISAAGLLCRMYLGWEKDNPALVEGIKRIAERGPSIENYYFNYYAAQAIFQQTSGEGPLWQQWNKKLRDQLIEQQSLDGHARGSWYIRERDTHNPIGGRLYMTSLATMTLEVYYRYLPIYKLDTKAVEFPE